MNSSSEIVVADALKRTLDVVCSCLGLLILALPLLLLMLIVRLTSPGPALYWSDRVGRHGVIFSMPKLRTMNLGTPELPTHELPNAEAHITRLGRFLRRSSIDELPQLYSVLKGDMSIVGPRPMIPAYKDILAQRREAGVDVLRPGITGWAQVNGRDDISTDAKLALDVEYLQSKSVAHDLWIIYRTIIYVINRSGISH